jgi:O-succinylbenzoate synthase
MAFYTGGLFPAWKGSLFNGALKFQLLSRLDLKGDTVVKEERLLQGLSQRIRDVIVDGLATGAFAAVDPALAATFLLTALNGIATWYRPDGRLSADRIADHYVDLALRSLSEDHR